MNPQIGLNVGLGQVPKMPNGMHVLSGNVKTYIQNGKKHRLRGPAEIYPNGKKIWFKNGFKHRKNGPAVENPDGSKEYWEEGKFIKSEK